MKIRFLGAHNTETSKVGLMCLLLDGVIALDAGSLTSKLTLEQQLALTSVLLTHPHYDHFRDLPMLGMNLYLNEGKVKLYGSQAARDTLEQHVFDGKVYSKFLEKGTIDFHIIEPLKPFDVEGYKVTAVPVNHSVPGTGFQVERDGKRFFYTGDTGPGLAEAWKNTSPSLFVIEVTASNRYMEWGRTSGHMTPDLLKEELISFKAIRGYLPRVVTVHMNPALEMEIAPELEDVAEAMACDISLGWEGEEIEV
jgi:ribonuclease BN (tRNA processing enzyme)